MSLTILIIDDEPHLPYQLARFLKKQSYEVYTAPDGETGLLELQKNSIDLVLLDVRLPQMSGLDVLGWLRRGLFGGLDGFGLGRDRQILRRGGCLGLHLLLDGRGAGLLGGEDAGVQGALFWR